MAAKRHKPFVPQTLGERVAHARRLLGLYEGEDILPPHLAERVGVTTNAVYAWEAGTEPGKANRQRLADVLRVTIEWLLHGVGGPPPPRERLSDPEADAATARSDAAKAAKAKKPAQRAKGSQ